MLQARGIAKRFGSVIANEDVDFELESGEVHAIVGENGAGKTTLMRILYGMYQPDSGEIRLRGRPIEFAKPLDSIEHGIGMVHQHFMLAPSLTVVENITLGAEPTRRGLFDHEAAVAAIREPMAQLGLDDISDVVTGTLNVATQQKLEIIKVLYRGAEIIILDEPSAVLTPQETDELFVLMRNMVADGASIIFITHKLREVFSVADRITVLRGGKGVYAARVADTDTATVVAAMTGRTDVNLGRVVGDAPDDTPVVLEVRSVSTEKPDYDAALKDVSFTVRAGEIVGIAGVDGNGQSVLPETLIGTVTPSSGSLWLSGRDVTGLAVSQRRNLGLSYVPEDRQLEGLPLHGTVLEGLAAGEIRRRRSWQVMGVALSREIRAWGRRMIEKYQIMASGTDAPCDTLSGGNQQKVVVARELEERCDCLILAQPTRGIDIGAIEFLYERIVEATERGCAVLLISADLDEILRLSNRVLVMLGGRVVAERMTTETSREELGAHMMGASPEEAAM